MRIAELHIAGLRVTDAELRLSWLAEHRAPTGQQEPPILVPAETALAWDHPTCKLQDTASRKVVQIQAQHSSVSMGRGQQSAVWTEVRESFCQQHRVVSAHQIR